MMIDMRVVHGASWAKRRISCGEFGCITIDVHTDLCFGTRCLKSSRDLRFRPPQTVKSLDTSKDLFSLIFIQLNRRQVRLLHCAFIVSKNSVDGKGAHSINQDCICGEFIVRSIHH